MRSFFWSVFSIATALKVMLIPAYYSTDFEVHRNWMAITHSLPLHRWYLDATSKWTLDYPPFFAYFEWLLSCLAKHVDPGMLKLQNLNYASPATVYFQRISVIVVDIIFALAVRRILQALRISKQSNHHFIGEVLLLHNIGLIFIDNIHFQYNGFLFGILLFSISFLLEGKYLASAFTFAVLLNFKHIFLYIAPAFGIFFIKFYCLEHPRSEKLSILSCLYKYTKLCTVGLLPFILSFGPFWRQLPIVLQRLFPFKRGLTHAYWAPNFWALYNAADKVAAFILKRRPQNAAQSTTSGLVQDVKHLVLPTVTPATTFGLTALFMVPIIVKLYFYTKKSEAKLCFLRAIVICALTSFMFGWHVHEKAILMSLIPLCLLCLLHRTDAKYTFILSVAGYFSLLPLMFHINLVLPRYSLFSAFIAFMYTQFIRIHKAQVKFNTVETIYMNAFAGLPFYEFIVSRLFGLNVTLPFMPLLLTSVYCSLGVSYVFIRYYIHALDIRCTLKTTTTKRITSKKPKPKTKQKKR